MTIYIKFFLALLYQSLIIYQIIAILSSFDLSLLFFAGFFLHDYSFTEYQMIRSTWDIACISNCNLKIRWTSWQNKSKILMARALVTPEWKRPTDSIHCYSKRQSTALSWVQVAFPKTWSTLEDRGHRAWLYCTGITFHMQASLCLRLDLRKKVCVVKLCSGKILSWYFAIQFLSLLKFALKQKRKKEREKKKNQIS